MAQTLINRDTEIFVYLGKINVTHFFIHTHYTGMTNDATFRMCGQIYNVMIQETMIRQNDNVLIFDIDPNDGIYTPVCVEHVLFQSMIFPPDEVGGAFKQLMEIDRPETDGTLAFLVSVVDGECGPIFTHEIPGSSFTFPKLPVDTDYNKMPWLPVERCITVKPISYLDELADQE